jgi:hypothetical protein
MSGEKIPFFPCAGPSLDPGCGAMRPPQLPPLLIAAASPRQHLTREVVRAAALVAVCEPRVVLVLSQLMRLCRIAVGEKLEPCYRELPPATGGTTRGSRGP